MTKEREPTLARVDTLVDENASEIDVPENSPIGAVGEPEKAVGGTSPAGFWLYGLVGLAIVVAIILAMQIFSGSPGSDVQPGTPTAEPVVAPAAPAS